MFKHTVEILAAAAKAGTCVNISLVVGLHLAECLCVFNHDKRFFGLEW